MLILLPPSEGKTAAPEGNLPVDFAELSFPELTGEREIVLETLEEVSARETALEELRVGASLAAEVERNTHLLSESAHPAIETYTGVLFEALDYSSFSPGIMQRAQNNILISSALWGVVRPHDRIPAYRLSMGIKLGNLGSLAHFWRGPLHTALSEITERELIIDCRSAAYAKSWSPPCIQTLTVRVERIRHGERKTISHMAKHYRGKLARYLISTDLAECSFAAEGDIAHFVRALDADWEVEYAPATVRKPGVLTLLIRE